jgi:hypothetical protein
MSNIIPIQPPLSTYEVLSLLLSDNPNDELTILEISNDSLSVQVGFPVCGIRRKYQGSYQNLPLPSELTDKKLSTMVRDIYNHPKRYSNVVVTQDAGDFLMEEEEGGYLDYDTKFTGFNNLYLNELRSRKRP